MKVWETALEKRQAELKLAKKQKDSPEKIDKLKSDISMNKTKIESNDLSYGQIVPTSCRQAMSDTSKKLLLNAICAVHNKS